MGTLTTLILLKKLLTQDRLRGEGAAVQRFRIKQEKKDI